MGYQGVERVVIIHERLMYGLRQIWSSLGRLLEVALANLVGEYEGGGAEYNV